MCDGFEVDICGVKCIGDVFEYLIELCCMIGVDNCVFGIEWNMVG